MDFMSSPAGIGLLSAAAGGMAGARRGTPWNNVGRGLVTGLSGYAGAQDQIRQDSENKFAQQYKQMQMEQLQQQIANQKALREAATGAAQDATKPTQYSVGGQTFGAPEQAISSAQNMFSLPSGALPESMGQGSPLVSFDQQTPAPSIVDVSGGHVPQITKQETPDMRGAMYTRLMQAGFPEEAAKYAPKWTVAERFNEATGMPEKVLMDENNPSNVVPFGGSQADTIVADNTGGELIYRGSHSATPVGTVRRTVSPDSVLSATTARRGQDISNANAAAARDVTLRGQDLTNSATGKPPAGYRFTQSGNLEAIPGGPADIKAGEAGDKRAKQNQASREQAKAVISTVKEARKLVGYSTVGLGGTLRNIPMTRARDLDAKLTTIKANLGFDRLQQMRDLSPTGGALGQVAVQELTALQATVASLDQLQTPGQLENALAKIEKHYSNWEKTLNGNKPSDTALPGGWTVEEN
ncbi:MAG: hypothetical protein ACYCZR_03750 [Burkholderiales bacterium]